MKQKLKLNTIFSAAFGAALSYYGFTPVLRSRFAIPVVFTVLALIMLLVVLNIIFNNGNSYQNGRRKLFFIAFAAGFLLGFFSLTAARRAAILRFGLPDNEITGIAGQLLDDPRSSTSGRGLATLNLNESAGHGGVRTSAKGHITVFFTEEAMPRLKEFGRGSKVFVEGNFITAKNGLLFKAKSTHITAPPSSLNALRTKLRRGLTSIFNNERWGGLALALLLGIKDNLDGEMAERYRDAGCSYILALSGMHLAIVSSIVAFLLKKPLGVRPATIIGALFIVLYIYLVGAQPSLVRAGIAALLGALALFCSFPTSALHLLALSFLTQLVIDPGSGGTISFILSYLALAGILIFLESL
jgi:competence protein ComEC